MGYKKRKTDIKTEVELRELEHQQTEAQAVIDYNVMMGVLNYPTTEENEEA